MLTMMDFHRHGFSPGPPKAQIIVTEQSVMDWRHVWFSINQLQWRGCLHGHYFLSQKSSRILGQFKFSSPISLFHSAQFSTTTFLSTMCSTNYNANYGPRQSISKVSYIHIWINMQSSTGIYNIEVYKIIRKW